MTRHMQMMNPMSSGTPNRNGGDGTRGIGAGLAPRGRTTKRLRHPGHFRVTVVTAAAGIQMGVIHHMKIQNEIHGGLV